MPRVPEYQANIQLNAAPNVVQRGMSAAAPDGAFAAIGIGKALSGAVDLYQAARKEADDARVTEAITADLGELNKAELSERNTQLGAALGGADRFGQAATSIREKRIKELSPEQQALYAKRYEPLVMSARKTVLGHEMDQSRRHLEAIDESFMKQLANTAAGNPEALPDMISQATGRLKERFGATLAPEVLKQKTDEVDGYMTDHVIRRMALDGNLDGATALLAARGEGLKSRGELERTIKALRREKDRENDEAEGDAMGGLFMKLHQSGNSTKAMKTLEASPEFRALSPKNQARAVEHMQAKVERTMDRNRMAGDRAEAQARRGIEDSPEAADTFLSLMDRIQNDGAIPTAALWRYEPIIGMQAVKTLASANKQIGDAAGRWNFDKGDVELVAPKDKEDAKRFKALVSSRLTEWKEQNKGKLPGERDQQMILNSANAEWVDIGKVWNTTKKAYQIKPGDTEAMPMSIYEAGRKRGLSDSQIEADWIAYKEGKVNGR